MTEESASQTEIVEESLGGNSSSSVELAPLVEKETRALEGIGKTSDAKAKKSIVVLLRWVLMLGLVGLMLSSDTLAATRLPVQLQIVVLFLSNLFLSRLDAEFFERRSFEVILFVVDLLLITGSIWLVGAASDDLYLLYFILLMSTAVGQTFRHILSYAGIIAAVYLLVTYFKGGSEAVLQAQLLVRVPFIFVVSIFYGHLAQTVRKEKTKLERFQNSFDRNQKALFLTNEILRSIDAQETYERLTAALYELVQSGYIAIVSLREEQILTEAGEWDRYTAETRRITLINTLRVELSKQLEVGDSADDSGSPYFSHPFLSEAFTFIPFADSSGENDLYLLIAGRLSKSSYLLTDSLLDSAKIRLEMFNERSLLLSELEDEGRGLQLSDAVSSRQQAYLSSLTDDLKSASYSMQGIINLILSSSFGEVSEEQVDACSRLSELNSFSQQKLKQAAELSVYQDSAILSEARQMVLSDIKDEFNEIKRRLSREFIGVESRVEEVASASVSSFAIDLLEQIAWSLAPRSADLELFVEQNPLNKRLILGLRSSETPAAEASLRFQTLIEYQAKLSRVQLLVSPDGREFYLEDESTPLSAETDPIADVDFLPGL